MEEDAPLVLSPEAAAEELRRSPVNLDSYRGLIKLGAIFLCFMQLVIFFPVLELPATSAYSDSGAGNYPVILLMVIITCFFWFGFHSRSYEFLRRISTSAMRYSVLIFGVLAIAFLIWSHTYVCTEDLPGTNVTKIIYPYGKYKKIPVKWDYPADELNVQAEYDMKLGAHALFSIWFTWAFVTTHWIRIRRKHEATAMHDS